MITQEIPISLLMEPQKNLIFRQGDFGNQIKIKFPDLTGITSAEFRLIKPDDTFVVSTGEIVENDILITITDQMSVKSGLCIFNLRLINDSSNIYTYVGRALIDDNINLDDYAESVAEVNGLVFPDDFLSSADLSNYATKEYVNDAIVSIPVYTPPVYSTIPHKIDRKWIDNNDIWEVIIPITFTSTFFITVDLSSLNVMNFISLTGGVYNSSGGFIPFGYSNEVSIYTSSKTSMGINNNYYNSNTTGYVIIQYTTEE